MLELWLRGLAVGFSVAAPVGPIGILCIQRTLSRGRLAGFATGMGAATADMLYAILAAAGVGAVSGALVAHQDALRAVGGLFLIHLGLRAARARPARAPAAGGGADGGAVAGPLAGPLGDWAQTFLLTLSNPVTILSFAAIVAALGPAGLDAASAPASAVFIGGVLVGSAAWWLTLSGLSGAARRWLLPRLRWINVAAGVALLCFGAAIAVPAIMGWLALPPP